MRARLAVGILLSLGAGCGGGDANTPIADAAIDAPIDAPIAPDGPPACKPAPLLLAGTDVKAQGWNVIQAPPSTLTNTAGADFIQIDTSSPGNNKAGGQLLLTFTNVSDFTPPFKLAIVMKVLSVSPHTPDPSDAAVAIMPSLTGAFGGTSERDQMISIESGKISCGDGHPSVSMNLVDGVFHTYTLAVDADKTMTLAIDDQTTPVITRPQITLGGTFAIGDQTNDAGFDSSIQIRSVTKLCL